MSIIFSPSYHGGKLIVQMFTFSTGIVLPVTLLSVFVVGVDVGIGVGVVSIVDKSCKWFFFWEFFVGIFEDFLKISQPICTKFSEQDSFFWTGQNESKKCYAMITNNKKLNISVVSQLICTELSEQGLISLSWSKWVQEVLCYDQNWQKLNISEDSQLICTEF